MFASTKQARALLKLAFKAAKANLPSHTYSEKTTERDPNRRSVVFPIRPALADEVIHQARDLFKEAGFTKSVPIHTQYYIRVIAYKD